MSAKPYLDGQPSVVTVDGDAVGDIVSLSVTRTATNDKPRVSANQYLVDGGVVQKAYTIEMTVREGTTNATTGAHPERFFGEGDALAGDLVVTWPARGDTATGLDKTATMSCCRVAANNSRDGNGRLNGQINLDVLSPDGSTAPIAITWA